MDGIRKYSKEWFVANGTQEQRDALSGLKDGHGSKVYGGTSINGSIFEGSLDEVNERVANMEAGSKRGMPSSTFFNVREYGAENIFKALDADGDGNVTKQEIQDVAALSTKEFASKDDTSLSSTDLDILYDNAMSAVDAVLNENGNVTTYQYADGQYTEIKKDDDGNVISKYEENASGTDGERYGVEYNYQNRSTDQRYIDAQGRQYKELYDEDGSINDKTIETAYNEDGSKQVTTTTVGRTIVDSYNENGKLQDSEQTLAYDSDGVIDDTKQRSIGDCWILSGVNSLRNSKIGSEMIDDAITQNKDGSVTVSLKGVDKKYTYSPEEIGAHEYNSKNKSYSSGDIDMNLIEMAIADYREELIASGDYGKNSRDLSKTAGDSATVDDPIKGGQIDEAVYYLTGRKSDYYSKNEEQTQKLTEKYASNPEKYAMNVTFQEKDPSITDGTITTGHAYSIAGVDDDNVYVVNPWDASTQIAYPKEEFYSNVNQVTLTNLKLSFGEKIVDFFSNLFS